MGSFAIFVIGVPGQLRSSSLQNWVSKQSSYTVHFVEPVIAKFADAPLFLKVYLTLHYAHKLTDGEWGCAIAHQRAQNLAAELGVRHALFLEDDAEVGTDFTNILSQTLTQASAVGQAPAVIHGYHYGLGLGNSNGEIDGLSPLPLTPIYAIAYLMNKAALEKSLAATFKSFPVGKADFPSWSASTEWFRLAEPLVLGHDTKTSIVGDRLFASKQTGLIWQVLLLAIRSLLVVVPTPVRRNRASWELKQLLLGSRVSKKFLKLR